MQHTLPTVFSIQYCKIRSEMFFELNTQDAAMHSSSPSVTCGSLGDFCWNMLPFP